MGIHTRFEVIPFTLFLRRPGNLGKRQSTRVHHIFQMFFIRDIFCPGIGLNSHDMFTFLSSKRIYRNRVIAIYFLDRSISANGIRLGFRIRLIKIEIHIIARRHNNIMSHTGRLDPTTFTTPRHNGCFRSQTAFKYLIPTDQFTVFRDQVIFRFMDHVALKFVYTLHAVLFHQSLAFRTGFPGAFTSFVTTDMDIF